VQFRSEQAITLGTMSVGKYLLADHDMPFTGPLGLTTFVLDFLLSPADLQIEDAAGLRAGRYGAQILSEIPDSHPCYLVKGAYLLPVDQALTRRIVGAGAGTYSYHSMTPAGHTISLTGVATRAGQVDTVAINADGTQIRFTPAASGPFELSLGRSVEGTARAVHVAGFAAAPGVAVDVSLSPDLSVVRVGNAGAAVSASVRVINIDKVTAAHVKLDRGGIAVPSGHDLVVSVTDWVDLAMTARALPFTA